MGKKGKQKREEKEKKKMETMYTEKERRDKITKIMFEFSFLNAASVITDEVKNLFDLYMKTGQDIEKDIYIVTIQRSLVIRLYNSKGKKSYINMRSEFDERKPKTKEAISFDKKVGELKKEGVDLTKKS